MRVASWLMAVCMLIALACPARAASTEPAPNVVSLGQSIAPLNGPWRFKAGDDLQWASPDFDDSQWEIVDLTPAPGAHDGDVGLPGYVPGWNLRGHDGYTGYAWYRLKVVIDSDARTPLALAGPTYVDSTYQLYVDGTLLGGPGVFSGTTPIVHSVRPSVFALPAPSSAGKRAYLIAMRVWMDPLDASPDGGGVHIAPTIGTAESIDLLHQVQWLRTFKGYVVDAVEPLAFVLLAIMVLGLAACRTRDPYAWMIIALLLLALLRVNQVTYAWTSLQSLHGYGMATGVVLKPLVLATWTLAWRDWFGLDRSRWLGFAVGLLAAAYIAAALIGHPWFGQEMAEGVKAGADVAVRSVRLVLAALYVWIVARGLLQRDRHDGYAAVLAAILIGVGLFAAELNALGIPGIWFPYGTGVARGQYAYAAFIALMFLLVLVRLVQAATAHSRAMRGR